MPLQAVSIKIQAFWKLMSHQVDNIDLQTTGPMVMVGPKTLKCTE